jgi:hypothetical protein
MRLLIAGLVVRVHSGEQSPGHGRGGATDSRQPALHPVGFVIWFRYTRARRSTDGRIRKSPSIAGTSRYCGATALLAVARASAPRYDRPRHSFRLAASTVDRRPPAARRRPRPSCRLRRAPRWQGSDFLDLGGSAVAVAPRRSAHTLLAQAKTPKRGVPGSSRPCDRAMGRYRVGTGTDGPHVGRPGQPKWGQSPLPWPPCPSRDEHARRSSEYLRQVGMTRPSVESHPARDPGFTSEKGVAPRLGVSAGRAAARPTRWLPAPMRTVPRESTSRGRRSRSLP